MTASLPSDAIMASRRDIDAIRRRWSVSYPYLHRAATAPPDVDVTGVSGTPSLAQSHAAAWHAERIRREATDALAAVRRWAVVIDVGDGRQRYFIMTGPNHRVLERARALFEHPHAIAISPLEGAGEVIDSGLHVLTTKG